MRKVLLALVMVTGFAAGAFAATNHVWKDGVDGFTFQFPDTWTLQTEDTPSTKVRIAGPIGEDMATCRVKAEKDGRLRIYPQDLMDKAVQETLNRDFWEHEAAQFEQARVIDLYSMTGDKRINAMGVRISFLQESGHGKMNMMGTMVGSIYGDMRYVVSCFAREPEFKKYESAFNDIMGSVELDPKYHPFATGYYRNFLQDPKMYVPRGRPGTAVPMTEEYLPSGL